MTSLRATELTATARERLIRAGRLFLDYLDDHPDLPVAELTLDPDRHSDQVHARVRAREPGAFLAWVEALTGADGNWPNVAVSREFEARTLTTRIDDPRLGFVADLVCDARVWRSGDGPSHGDLVDEVTTWRHYLPHHLPRYGTTTPRDLRLAFPARD